MSEVVGSKKLLGVANARKYRATQCDRKFQGFSLLPNFNIFPEVDSCNSTIQLGS